ncbi:SCO family protein [Ramlibacter algicola]|uniref:SCO family protein n=1 Tax=Ramlibacter algicola TaxID=2795217 RepID=A0A934Q0J5_9BURK|nr:SCO family protein [Ramlibacter algicola]MBK0392581.1 SCO family protein [Ramlibacter algicola]
MTASTFTRRGALLSLAALAAAPAFAHDAHDNPLPAAPVPPDSIYRLDATLVDQEGRPFALSSLRGGPVLASMFYTSCDMVCPMIIETIHATLRAMPAADRARVKVLMASFDPERDTVAVLKKTAQARSAGANWILARADEATTRKLAAVLGIQYRRLSDGEYNHSSVVDVLDASGRIVARTGKLGEVDPVVLAAVRKIA